MGVMNLLLLVTVPDCNKLVPRLSAYQSTVFPVVAVANILTVSGPHLVPLVEVVMTAGSALMVAVIAVLVVDKQVPLLDSA